LVRRAKKQRERGKRERHKSGVNSNRQSWGGRRARKRGRTTTATTLGMSQGERIREKKTRGKRESRYIPQTKNNKPKRERRKKGYRVTTGEKKVEFHVSNLDKKVGGSCTF